MIKVIVKQQADDQRIDHITIKGHADFDQSGKDIVCAAVSALSIGLINSTEKLLGIDLNPEESPKEGGFLSWNIPFVDDLIVDKQLQLLMKALVLSLLDVEEEYGRYITVTTKD